jgi:type I restriction enzyme, S subunit
MDEWREIKLGKIIKSNIQSIDKSYPHKTIQYLDTGSITCGKIDTFQELLLNDAPSRAKRLVRHNDIVYSTVRPIQRHYGYITNPPHNLVVSTGFSVIETKTNLAEPLFVYYFLTSMDTVEYLDVIADGSTSAYPSLKPIDIEQLDIPFPPLKEQKAIASVLSSLDDKIDLLHNQNKTLEAMAETLFRQWFVEEADKDWEEGCLGDFINVKHGYAFKGKFISTEKNDQVLITPGNFKIGGGFKFGKMKYFNGEDYPKDYVFSPNDLILTMTDLSKEGDTLGYSALVPEHNQKEILFLHNQRVGRVEIKNNISKYFLYFLMKTDDYQWFILGGASGTSVLHTSPTKICSYPFQVPPMSIIESFDNIVDKLISKTHENQKQIQTLEKLRDTLLPKLMSGEVRVEY